MSYLNLLYNFALHFWWGTFLRNSRKLFYFLASQWRQLSETLESSESNSTKTIRWMHTTIKIFEDSGVNLLIINYIICIIFKEHYFQRRRSSGLLFFQIWLLPKKNLRTHMQIFSTITPTFSETWHFCIKLTMQKNISGKHINTEERQLQLLPPDASRSSAIKYGLFSVREFFSRGCSFWTFWSKAVAN